jgi:hypothetical protein
MRRTDILAVIVTSVAVLFVAPGVASATTLAPPAEVWAGAEGLDLAVTWAPPVNPTGVTGYRVTTSPVTSTVDVPVSTERAVIHGARPNTPYAVHVASLAGADQSATANTGATIPAPGGSYHALTPVRVLDTRTGPAPSPVNSIDLSLASLLGAHAPVASVVVNITVTAPEGPGFLTAYQTGSPQPVASNLNYVKGQTVATLAIVPVDVSESITLYSRAKAHIVVDAAGWFSLAGAASPAAGLFHGLSPARLLDTRTGLGATTPSAGQTIDLPVTGNGGVPATGVSAVVLNLTTAGSTVDGYVTAYPTGGQRPLASTLNFAKGRIVANRVIVPIGAGGAVSLFNAAGSTPLIADVTGWFGDGSDPASGGAYFAGVGPFRIMDTRPSLTLGPGKTFEVRVAGINSDLPAMDSRIPPTGFVASVTAVTPTAAGFLTAYPSNTPRPTASDVNFTAGSTVAGLVVGKLGGDGGFTVFNSAGRTDLVVDLSGFFLGDTTGPSTYQPTEHVATKGRLTDVAIESSNSVWASGIGMLGSVDSPPGERAVAAHWNGESWSTTPLPVPAGAVMSSADTVAVGGTDDVWIGGWYGTPTGAGALLVHWDGQSWHLAGTAAGAEIRAIAVLGPDDVWAAGVAHASPESALVEHWDGSAWTAYDAPADVLAYDGLAADHQGGVIATGSGSGSAVFKPYLVATRWTTGGPVAMTVPDVQPAPGPVELLSGVAMTSATDGWVAATAGVNALRFDGIGWNSAPLPSASGQVPSLHDFTAVTPNDVWAAGTTGQRFVTEHWDGAQWSVVANSDTGSYDVLYAATAAATDDAWFVGQVGSPGSVAAFAQHWNGSGWTSDPVPATVFIE